MIKLPLILPEPHIFPDLDPTDPDPHIFSDLDPTDPDPQPWVFANVCEPELDKKSICRTNTVYKKNQQGCGSTLS